VNTAKIVDKVDEGMEEKMLKLKGAAQDLFGSKERWVALVPKPGQLAPPGVACATAVVFKSTVITFGGLGARGLAGELWRCDLPQATWRRVDARGTAPAARAAHTAVVHGDHMYIFGGHGRDARGRSAVLGDCHRLDLRQAKWEPVVRPGDAPCARCSHSAVLCDGALYIFGGEGLQADGPAGGRESTGATTTVSPGSGGGGGVGDTPRFRMLGDLKFLPLEESLEEGRRRERRAADADAPAADGAAPADGEADAGGWVAVKPQGASPCARSGAAAASLGRCLFIVGGWDASKRELNDLWEFNAPARRWARIDAPNAPSPRTCAALVALPERLLLFGGCDARQPFATLHEYRPRPATARGRDLFGPGAGGVVGGGWAPLELAGAPPPPRSSHAMVAVGERLFVFGGFDGAAFLADAHCALVGGESK